MSAAVHVSVLAIFKFSRHNISYTYGIKCMNLCMQGPMQGLYWSYNCTWNPCTTLAGVGLSSFYIYTKNIRIFPPQYFLCLWDLRHEILHERTYDPSILFLQISWRYCKYCSFCGPFRLVTYIRKIFQNFGRHISKACKPKVI